MEDVELELQALQAVYGDDCRVLESWPPRVELLLRPRTADELSQQFVEIVLGIKANCKYPGAPPSIELVVIKGLDDFRQRSLLAVLSSEADQLLNEPMLVTISEAAVEFLTTNNYPDGECCFCLDPLMGDQAFMKLMTCFHCFHSDCFSGWWNWVSSEDEPVYCPVCRALINSEGVAHVQQELLKSSKGLDQEETTIDLAAELLESEAARQAEFSKLFEAQKARGGIIEPRGALSITAETVLIPQAQPSERSDESNPEGRIEQEEQQPQQAQTSDQPPAVEQSHSEEAQPMKSIDPGSNAARSRSRRSRHKAPANKKQTPAWVRKEL